MVIAPSDPLLMNRPRLLGWGAGLALLVAGAAWQAGAVEAPFQSARDASSALSQAQADLAAARERGRELEAQAAGAVATADRTAREAAAMAAKVQIVQAQIALSRAKVAEVGARQAALRLDLAGRQAPLVRLTGALEMIARRPLVFGLLRPGSLKNTVYLRAVLATMEPEVAQRTAGLRQDIDRARALLAERQTALADLRRSEGDLAARRGELTTLLASQRLASREAQGLAARENDRVLALAEQARDLSGLLNQLDEEAARRDRLAALPGPVLRPARPEAAVSGQAQPVEPAAPPALAWMMPLQGKLLTGFGEAGPDGPSRGMSLAPEAGAQIVAPANGRLAFAGPYRGYGRIVIIEHPGGWVTLITGFDRIDAQVGETLVQGAPLGTAAPGRPVVSIELRKDGSPVNPVVVMRG